MPITSATETATRISASVSMLASHRPSTPSDRNPRPASSAILQPASSPPITAAAVTTPIHVIRSRTFVTPSRNALRKFFSGVRK